MNTNIKQDESKTAQVTKPFKISAIGVAHFSIPVSNLEKSIAFYVENVGLRFINTVESEGMTFLDAGGGVCIILVRTDKPNGTAFVTEVHHSFMIAHDDFEAVARDLESRGIPIEREDFRKGTVVGPRLYVWDPDGHQIELLDRTRYAGHYLSNK